MAVRVSICLTTYNRASVLSQTIDSLLTQTFSDFELIINDDCSTDDTKQVCRDYETRDKRVKYYCNTHNLANSDLIFPPRRCFPPRSPSSALKDTAEAAPISN